EADDPLLERGVHARAENPRLRGVVERRHHAEVIDLQLVGGRRHERDEDAPAAGRRRGDARVLHGYCAPPPITIRRFVGVAGTTTIVIAHGADQSEWTAKPLTTAFT